MKVNINRIKIEKSTWEGKALESALDNALKQSEAGQVRPHEEVWSEIRQKFRKKEK